MRRPGAREPLVRRVVAASLLASLLLLPAAASAEPKPSDAGAAPNLPGGLLDAAPLVSGPATEVIDDLVASWRYDASSAATLDHVREVVGADHAWDRGLTGAGVGVALIDTGGVPVAGLTSGNVVNGPDLSFESQAPDLRHLDTFGHGTHLAGIIAGRDPDGADHGFLGVAPDAELVSLKLGSYDGAVDVSQIIAAIDWVVQHRDDGGHAIRVLNLSYGTDGTQDRLLDPLAHAVENAWRHGIVVVVSAGNDGEVAPALNDPASDPLVLAVGAADTNGTVRTPDDTVPSFSSPGDATRRPDLVAPGQSVVSLRNPGSLVDVSHPGARVGDRFFKGSGTSQAAAVVSGAVALLLQQRPDLTPDQVKALLTASATPLRRTGAAQGAGMLDLARALDTPTPDAHQRLTPSTGLGSLEAARGTSHVAHDGVELTGEQHVLGAWDAPTWAVASAAGTAWDGGVWHGARFTSDCWCGSSWAAGTWDTADWSGATWSGARWTGTRWTGTRWTGARWTGAWDGARWSGARWTGSRWSATGAATGLR